jgi:hypothetical protein
MPPRSRQTAFARGHCAAGVEPVIQPMTASALQPDGSIVSTL